RYAIYLHSQFVEQTYPHKLINETVNSLEFTSINCAHVEKKMEDQLNVLMKDLNKEKGIALLEKKGYTTLLDVASSDVNELMLATGWQETPVKHLLTEAQDRVKRARLAGWLNLRDDGEGNPDMNTKLWNTFAG